MTDYQRYHRQMILPGFGLETQDRLQQARILVVGAGGLGCPALQYLAAAGVGTLGIIDFDKVELTNLHRQVLFSEADIGFSKAVIAAKKLMALNRQIKVEAFDHRLSTKNAAELIGAYDLIIDGSDNFATRYLVNDACVLLQKPLIYGAIYRYEGQVAVFNMADTNGDNTNYRDLFPNPPAPGEMPNCVEAGVIGVLPGIIGSFQANEAIKIITKIGKPLINTLFTYNALNNTSYELQILPNASAYPSAPKNLEELADYDYALSCGHMSMNDIPAEALETMVKEDKNLMLLDVRELHEIPRLDGLQHLSIPLGQLNERIEECGDLEKMLVFCQSGVRSQRAIELLQQKYPERKLYNLKGGINQWIQYQNSKK
ncbi:MAG: molybdopterin-synthase adenylyltransferase MoeB [Cyclobacteriaceae bacterium]